MMERFSFVESMIDVQSSNNVRPNAQINLVQRSTLWLAS